MTNGLNDFFATVESGGISLMILGFTGAIGQVFLFVTISKFGALNCALLGLLRKMLSLVLSFLLYGHTMNAIQTVGLTLSVAAMIANFYEKGGKKKEVEADKKASKEDEQVPLMMEEGQHDDAADGDGEGQVEMTSSSVAGRGNGAAASKTQTQPQEDNLLDFEEVVGPKGTKGSKGSKGTVTV
jgi:UDP-galactose transporter B1